MQFRSRSQAVGALVGSACFLAFWIGLGMFFVGGICAGLIFLALSVPRGGQGALDAIGEHIETHVSLRKLSTARAAVVFLRGESPA